jgi:hypothetical protein
MKLKHRGSIIDDESLMMLTTLRNRRESDEGPEGATGRELGEAADINRQQVHHRLTNNLEPAGLIERVGTRTHRNVEDAAVWGLTAHGADWLNGIDDADLPPATASNVAVEKATDAIRVARDAEATAEDADEKTDKLNRRVGRFELRTKERLDEAEDDVDDEARGRIADAEDEINELRGAIDGLSERIDRIEANPTDHLDGLDGRLSRLASREDALQARIGEPPDGEDRTVNERLTAIDSRLTDLSIGQTDTRRFMWVALIAGTAGFALAFIALFFF